MQEIVSQEHNHYPEHLEAVLQGDHPTLVKAKEGSEGVTRVMVIPDTIPTLQDPDHHIHKDIQEEADCPVPKSTDITKKMLKDIHQDSQGNLF
jgi:hypothetical protein